MSHARVDALGNCDVIAIRIHNHECLHSWSRASFARVYAKFFDLGDHWLDVSNRKRKRTISRTFGQLVDLKPTTTGKSPFSHLRHWGGVRRLSQQILIPDDSRL